MAEVPLKVKGVWDGRQLDQGLRKLKTQTAGIGKDLKAAFGGLAAYFGIREISRATEATIDFKNALGALEVQSQRVGVASDDLLKGLQKVTAGQVSLADLTVTASNAIALLGAESIPQLDELAAIAAKASTALGTDLTAAFNDIVKGIGRQSRLILDNLGLMVSVREANERYAATLGKVVSELTETEKKQAFLNETIRQGNLAFGDIEAAINPVKQMRAAVADLKTAFGDLLIDLGITEGIKGLTSAVRGLVDGLNKLEPEQIRAIATSLGLIAAAAGAPKIWEGVRALGAWFTGLGVWFAGLVIWGTAVKDTLLGLGAALVAVVKTWKEFIPVDGLLTGEEFVTFRAVMAGIVRSLPVLATVAIAIGTIVAAIRNWRESLTLLGSAIRLVSDVLSLLFGWVDKLAALIPGITSAMDLLDKVFLRLTGTLEAVIRFLDVMVNLLRDLIYGSNEVSGSLRRLNSFLDHYAERMGWAEEETEEFKEALDRARAEAQRVADSVEDVAGAIDSIDTGKATAQLDSLIGRFLALSEVTRQAIITRALEQGLVVQRGGPIADILEQLTGRPAELWETEGGVRRTISGRALAEEYGIGAILEELIGWGAGEQAERLRAALGFGAAPGGGEVGEGPIPKELFLEAMTVMKGERWFEELFRRWTEALERMAASVTRVVGEPYAVGKPKLSWIERLKAMGWGSLAEYETAKKGPRDKRDLFGFDPKEIETVFDRFINNLADTLGDFIEDWGWKGGEADWVSLIKKLTQPITGDWGAGMAAGMPKGFGGLFGGLISGGLGWITRQFLDVEKPLEIEQPVDIRIVDIETRLMNFFNFRGMDPFTYSSSFRTAFEGGLY